MNGDPTWTDYAVDLDFYVESREQAARQIARYARRFTGLELEVDVNRADVDSRRSVYLTVTGTSAEAGDDGQAGRGNRSNGLIAPGRPMTMESVAGKNPVNHVGKLYNLVAGLASTRRCRTCRRPSADW